VKPGSHVALLLAALCGSAFAQPAGGDFTVRRSVVAAGTVEAVGDDFIVTATAGQSDAGRMQGGDFRVQGGFWPAPLGSPARIFQDGFE
jgi:hypothetical protein